MDWHSDWRVAASVIGTWSKNKLINKRTCSSDTQCEKLQKGRFYVSDFYVSVMGWFFNIYSYGYNLSEKGQILQSAPWIFFKLT